MARAKKYYRCQECGYESPNWMGRCSSCGNWNTFIEYYRDKSSSRKGGSSLSTGDRTAGDRAAGDGSQPLTKITDNEQERIISGITEFDRVLGGGLVNGSLVLLGGAPGIGKSTLILQVAFLFGQQNKKVLYIAGEESRHQLALRAERIGAYHDNIFILSTTSYQSAAGEIMENDFDIVIVDSIQTIYDEEVDSSPGSLVQVREVTQAFLRLSKGTGIPVILIGHVTKKGQLAGPRIMEHMVDTVLYLEGDSSNNYRLLKASKNRFGSIAEVGVFSMEGSGLMEISNPSNLFLREKPAGSSGSVVVPVSEGSRIILVEAQVLVTSGTYGASRRITSGIDRGRANLLLAVLEKHLGLNLADRDIHFNIVGGLKVSEPALDLALAAATISSYFDLPLDSELAVCGEVGLSGEIRSIPGMKSRIKEVVRMGFSSLIFPRANYSQEFADFKLDLKPVKKIDGLERQLKKLTDRPTK